MNDGHSKATFENPVGAIDGTLHEIQRPPTEPEHEFYSGHGRYYCFSTQLGECHFNFGHSKYHQYNYHH